MDYIKIPTFDGRIMVKDPLDRSFTAEKKEDMSRCSNAFYKHIAVANYIAYTEALDAVDMMRDKGMLRQQSKRCAAALERECLRYEATQRKELVGEERQQFHINYMNLMHISAEQPLLFIRMAVKKQLDSKHYPEAATLSHMYTALLLLQQAQNLYDTFFKEWQATTGYDLKSCYSGEDMSGIVRHMSELEDAVTKQMHITEVFHYGTYDIKAAYSSYIAVLRDEEAEGKAVKDAITRTPKLAAERLQLQQKEVAAFRENVNNILDLEREEMRNELSNKFKTKKL